MPGLLLLASLALLPLISALYSSNSDVIQLDEKSFKEKVLKSDSVWFVEFYAPWCGHCKSLVPEYEKAASHLKGVVNIAAVDATAAEGLAQKYQVQGFPTIKVFGADKRNPVDYAGQRTADAFTKEAMNTANKLVKDRQAGKSKPSKKGKSSPGGSGGSGPSPSPKKPKSAGGGGGSGGGGRGGKSAVLELTEDNFDKVVLESDEPFLVSFTAPWCGHCKKLHPEWEQAAEALQDMNFNLANVDATENQALAARFGVQGYPTIKVFPPGSKTGTGMDYNGPREADGIVAHAMGILEQSNYQPGVAQLTDPAQLKDKCKGQKICVIAVLPHILDSGKEGRDGYLATVTAAAKKVKAGYFAFTWSEGGAQAELEQSMGLTFGYPAVVAFSKERKAKAVHVGSFSGDGISAFLNGLMTGSTPTTPMEDGLPPVTKVEPWDGQDAAIVEEEEFSLEDLFGDEEL